MSPEHEIKNGKLIIRNVLKDLIVKYPPENLRETYEVVSDILLALDAQGEANLESLRDVLTELLGS